MNNFNEYQSVFLIITLIASLFYVVFFLLYYILISCIFFSITYFLKGTGSLRRVVEYVGYGFIPMVISSVISGIYIIYLALFTKINVSDINNLYVSISDVIKQSNDLFIIRLIGLLSILCSGYIWVYSVKHSRNVNVKNSIIAVGLPIGIYVLYYLYTYANM